MENNGWAEVKRKDKASKKSVNKLSSEVIPSVCLPMSPDTQIGDLRGNGQIADLRVSANCIIRTQVRLVKSTNHCKPTSVSFPYDPRYYDFVYDMKHKMSDAARKAFFDENWVEVVVDLASIEASANDYPHPNVIDQLAILGPSFECEVNKMKVLLHAPNNHSELNVLDKYLQSSAEMLKSGEYSTVRRAFPFVSELVDKLQGFTSLKELNIIVHLDERLPFNFGDVHERQFDVVLPFYELDSFPEWNLQWIAPNHVEHAVHNFLIQKLNKKSEKYYMVDKEAFDHMVISHESLSGQTFS